jgi:hypothetical protein
VSTVSINGATQYACKCGSCTCGFVCGAIPLSIGGTLGGVCVPPGSPYAGVGGDDAGAMGAAWACKLMGTECRCENPNLDPSWNLTKCDTTMSPACFAHDVANLETVTQECDCVTSTSLRDALMLQATENGDLNVRVVSACPPP